MNDPAGSIFAVVGIGADEDVILARQKARQLAQQMGFSLLDQTRIVTAVSELARNIVVHAGSGKVSICQTEGRPGLRVICEDQGPGIANLEQALTDGFSSAGSMGLGLKGARKLTDEFTIDTAPGSGTTVTVTKWR